MNVIFDRARIAPQSGASIHPVILSGGSGTRLWPLSRALLPKQLLRLTSERTMLQDTVLRFADDESFADPILVCNAEHRFLIVEQLVESGARTSGVIIEPVARSTAPALATAAMIAMKADPEAVLLAQPADHVIGRLDIFRDAVAAGCQAVARGRLVAFGIAPSRAETGYGYIEQGDPLELAPGTYGVNRFIEKPDEPTARELVGRGNFLWNSGIFLYSARQYLEELKRFEPEMYEACVQAVDRGREKEDCFALDEEALGCSPSKSVDHAVMERTDCAAVVPVDMAWSDIGSWNALREAKIADGDGNVVEGDVVLEGVSNSYIRSDNRLVAAIGLNDVVIVESADAVLAAPADRAPEIGRLIARLREKNRHELVRHRKVYRPWGYYETMDEGDRFQVKRIMVKPGAKLSTQMHHHRAEHWVVVSGTALITCGDGSRLLHENESTYIPLGTRHRLENPGKLPLHVIEVQSGPYLGEDDIVRFEDDYGRC